MYKVVRKKAELVVTAAEMAAFECLYVELGDKGKEKKLYRLTKARERKRLGPSKVHQEGGRQGIG